MGCINVIIKTQDQLRVSINPICEMGIGFTPLLCNDGFLFSMFNGVVNKIFVKSK